MLSVYEITCRLRAAGIENARQEARLLAAHVTGLDAATLRTGENTPLDDPAGLLEAVVRRREKREPLQYVLGVWSFWRQEYEVSPDCLIPRADTEVLLETAMERIPKNSRFLDLCTGSGCIAISLLCERPDLTGAAVDLFPRTLALAERNAARNGVTAQRLSFLQADVLAKNPPFSPGTADAILSNPPYIPTAETNKLAPELAFEPAAALDGGEDGLVFYRRMLEPDWQRVLRPGGFYLFEIGYDQGAALRLLGKEAGCTVEILRDLGGNDRVAVVVPKAEAAF